MSALLELIDLNVHYGAIHSLKGINVEVREKEVVTILGANGAGKTTTLRSISGLISPSSGSIKFENNEIHKTPAHKIVGMGIAQSPEGRMVFPELTVKENLELGAYLRKDKAQIQKDMDYTFELFPRVKERLSQLAGTLSGGEQQMVAIARAYMARPHLLLLDEPSLGIAPILVRSIFEAIKHMNEEQGITILLVEQNASLALKYAHRGYVMETGKIILEGSSQELANNEDVKKAYLGH